MIIIRTKPSNDELFHPFMALSPTNLTTVKQNYSWDRRILPSFSAIVNGIFPEKE
jgi:hypothetical protein